MDVPYRVFKYPSVVVFPRKTGKLLCGPPPAVEDGDVVVVPRKLRARVGVPWVVAELRTTQLATLLDEAVLRMPLDVA